MYTDTFEEFEKWFTKFHEKHGGYAVKNLRRWWNRTESSHQNFRFNYLKGEIRLVNHISLKADQKAASDHEIDIIVDKILNIIPEYLNAYEFSRDVFSSPVIPNGTHNVVKTGKHILSYASKYLDRDPLSIAKTTALNRLISELGLVWAKKKTSDIELDVTINTSPRSFLLLGHYGPDQDSCFRQGSDKTQHKWILGQTENTFVVSVSKFIPKKNSKRNVARCFGFADQNGFHLANYYFTNGEIAEGDFIEAIKETFDKIAGVGHKLYNTISYIEKSVFHNEYGRWSFCKRAPDRESVLYPNVNFIRYFTCENCAYESRTDENWDEVDDLYVCPVCKSNANICEKTDKPTFSTLVSIIDSKGKELSVHPSVAQDFQICEECSLPSEELVLIDDKKTCKSCLDTQYDECDECHNITHCNDMIYYGYKDICTKCNSKGIDPFDNGEFNDENIEYTTNI